MCVWLLLLFLRQYSYIFILYVQLYLQLYRNKFQHVGLVSYILGVPSILEFEYQQLDMLWDLEKC